MSFNGNDWENWLSKEKGEYLLRIRDLINNIDKINSRPLAFYTPHGPKHFKMVEDNLHKLIPDEVAEKYFEEEERFYLLASAWLHDLGMYPSVAKDVWKVELNDNEIRERHHITTARFIVNHFQECGVDEVDKEFFATLCIYHRRIENIEKCPTKKSVGVGNKSYELKLLAAYLRLADSLDIGSYRTPTPDYAICLAYNIPHESKMHWIKNRIISGIFIDSINHKISVEFIEPRIDDDISRDACDIINEKLDYIIEMVLQDLNEELSSVKQILISKGGSYFNEIIWKKNLEYIPEQTRNDLIEMAANYDILVHPSASKLLEMVLITMANICGYHLVKYHSPKKLNSGDNRNVKKLIGELTIFLGNMENELLTSRPCHYGLLNLLQKCKVLIKSLGKDSLDIFVGNIGELYSAHHNYRHNIRENSSGFFKESFNNRIRDEKNEFLIVLYGYSELAIKTICGFRDSVLLDLYPNSKVKDFYGNNIERELSNRFKIIICEAQPKTITAIQDRLLYHDGIRYAEALSNRNFKNIVLIPDATLGTILINYKIDMILVGANGFDSKNFVHSAGHTSVINLGLYHKIENKCLNPYIILSTTKEKYTSEAFKMNNVDFKDYQLENKMEGIPSFFRDKDVVGREKIWFTQDLQMLKQLNNHEIKLFNPREDKIPIKSLDYIITDNGWYPIKFGTKDETEVSSNVATFINAQKNQ